MDNKFLPPTPNQDETRIEVLVYEIFMLIYTIQQELGLCCFFSYSGHVNSIDVSISESRVNYRKTIYEATIVYVKKDGVIVKSNESIIKRLQNIHDGLFKLKNERLQNAKKS